MSTKNPLWTEDQAAMERLALKLIERADVRAAREAARVALFEDPETHRLDGRMGLDKALDQWVLGLAMREANGDPADPLVTWNISNPPRNWFGHVYLGAAVSVDNPDNFNREIPVEGGGNYEVTFRFSADPPQFSIVGEIEPEHHAGLGINIGALTLQELSEGLAPGDPVVVTIGPGEGGRFHFRTEPGKRMQFYTRDSQRHWGQLPAQVTVRRLDPPAGWRPRTEDEIAAKIIEDTPALVHFWATMKNRFLNDPEPHRLVGPLKRDGGWGYMAGARFALPDDEAFVITIDPVGCYYTGMQITDPWTIAPDPMLRMVSLNTSQVTPNPDGTLTYVLSAVDPGIANWVDTVGLAEGWLLMRWQGVPAGADPATFIREGRVIKIDDVDTELPASVPRVDLAGRREQLKTRARLFAIRTAGPDWPL